MFDIKAFQMTAKNEPFELVETHIDSIDAGKAVVEIAGCGVCHTDLSFWHYGVPTKQDLPLVLGHEISGTVIEGPENIKGKKVIIPAVLPCGECGLCRNGRGNICQKQLMPGNDFNGGFASHIITPAKYLVPVPEDALADHSLAELSVIADAISTPYQVIVKSKLEKDDFCIVIGVGGVGVYTAQLANILGGKVLALDISQEKLDQLEQIGITNTLNIKDLGVRDIKKLVKAKCKEMGASPYE